MLPWMRFTTRSGDIKALLPVMRLAASADSKQAVQASHSEPNQALFKQVCYQHYLVAGPLCQTWVQHPL